MHLELCNNQKPLTKCCFRGGINTIMSYSLYFHIPFCKKRCHYCDFYTTTGLEDYIPAYIEALIKEIRIGIRAKCRLPVHTIYFGGGTPSLLPVKSYERLIKEISSVFNLADDVEISLEANPGTLSLQYLRELRNLGFNRISLGVQSTNDFDLIRLDRIHCVEDVLSSLSHARLAGFENISMDLIFGLPWQDLGSWQRSLARALHLKPEHFSIYALIIEPGTPLYGWYERGLLAEKDQDLEGDMYELAIEQLADAGYEHYEISNWYYPRDGKDFRCRHNLQYWRNGPYFGFGAGAHGYVEGVRIVNSPNLLDYLGLCHGESVNKAQYPATSAAISIDSVDRYTQMRDFMWLGLRLVDEGVSTQKFYEQYGESMQNVFSDEISYLLSNGLVTWAEDDMLRLTARGIMVANQVFMQFV